jgi:hypothetical protein
VLKQSDPQTQRIDRRLTALIETGRAQLAIFVLHKINQFNDFNGNDFHKRYESEEILTRHDSCLDNIIMQDWGVLWKHWKVFSHMNYEIFTTPRNRS